jgi:hypothetical protein
MTKLYYFFKWLFNWKKWYSFQKRYTIYAIAGFGTAFATGIMELIYAPFLMIWLDFTVELMIEKWNKFNKEQEKLLDDIKQEQQ